MEYFFKYKLTEDETREAEAFYDALRLVTVEQHPRWNDVTASAVKRCNFLAKDSKGMACYAVIEETGVSSWRFLAQINFGPIFRDADSLIESVKAIYRYYRNKGFLYLGIQLGVPADDVTGHIEYALNRALPIKYSSDRYNKSSIVIDLGLSEEAIFRNFSKGHKSAVKAGAKSGLRAERVLSAEEAAALAEVYLSMAAARRLQVDPVKTRTQFRNIFGFLSARDKGWLVSVKDSKGVLIGGIVIVIQGDSARYYKGAADPSRKDVPVLHLAFWEAIRMAKAKGLKIFDFWGYNHYVDRNDQVYRINIFKKGFGGRFIFYPKVMHICLKPFGYFVYRQIRTLRNRIRF